jgi:hypothetical protein
MPALAGIYTYKIKNHPIKIENNNITIIGINWIRGKKKAL